MKKFIKTLLLGIGASAVVIGAVIGGMLWMSAEPEKPAEPVADNAPHVVRMAPLAVQVGGYDLSGRSNAKLLLVSIELLVTGSKNRDEVCRLMPRLVSTVNSELSRKASFGKDFNESLETSVPLLMRRKFNEALGDGLIDKVTVKALQGKRSAPAGTCPDQV